MVCKLDAFCLADILVKFFLCEAPHLSRAHREHFLGSYADLLTGLLTRFNCVIGHLLVDALTGTCDAHINDKYKLHTSIYGPEKFVIRAVLTGLICGS